ncbi:MAG TPA: shikimate kinase [Streptosporangiaceae bacterium]|nr:shikimate kinase [Streptosporangiaceae bacterium]
MTLLALTASPPIVVVGAPGAGKTTLARRLAEKSGLSYLDMDAFYHGPQWSVRDDFAGEVERLTASSGWVADSASYPQVVDMLWARAGTVIFLDAPLHVLLVRLLTRTVRRQLNRHVLSHGNRESLGRVFSRRHPIAKVLTSYASRRAEVLNRAASYTGTFVHVTNQRQTNAITADIRRGNESQQQEAL